MQAAFRDLHGHRLHGFALLVTLGNRSVAAAVASRALADGAGNANELRHPERAAAWLRKRALQLMPREAARLTAESEPERRAALRALGVTDGAFSALATLTVAQRTLLVVAAIERLEERDIESIVGRRGADLRQMIARVRDTYLAVASDTYMTDEAPALAPRGLASRIAAEAARTLGGRAEASP